MSHTYNGIKATELDGAVWRKSSYSNANGNCVEFASLQNGDVAMRNSRDPHGPALIYTRSEIECLLLGAKDGEFDDLV
ncbi:DUF397 domain-containing protein [Mangrovactinospora gilvigrisea]|uniref:DUF397 domain-containing protein n=1 Tax=Mangrovactinospora gilvigrisea TaxID=1428644 RepID=A0A1J7C3M1_9ACTN|nr:DUF397 domain-containing protein [Mangrovactinospora gilvigrisea]OIV36144.1 DUF397 domain-containing protein [Mangrovactinospora gilvigrisea]